MACLRLVTRLPDRPDRRVPCFISCRLRSTFSCAFAPYLLTEVLGFLARLRVLFSMVSLVCKAPHVYPARARGSPSALLSEIV